MKLRDERKREAIYSATISLAGTVGVAGLKMSAIAKRAKLASGTLYVYFENKEELLNEVYGKLKKEGTLSIIGKLGHLPTKMQFYAMWENSLKYRVYNQDKMVFLEQFLISPYISQENRVLGRQFMDYLFDLLDKAKSEQIIKNTGNHILLSLLSGYIRDLSKHIATNDIHLDKKLVDETFVICWDALKR